MNFLVDQLGKLGYIEKDEKKSEITIPGIPKYITNDVEINDILRAMCGYKKKKLELFEKGDNILLNDYRLTTPESIRKFVEEVEDISWQWQNIAFKQKILQPLKDHFWVKNNQNFLKIWSDAKQQVNGNTSC